MKIAWPRRHVHRTDAAATVPSPLHAPLPSRLRRHRYKHHIDDDANANALAPLLSPSPYRRQRRRGTDTATTATCRHLVALHTARTAAKSSTKTDVAKNLGGKPPERINPKYAHFALRPSDAPKNQAKNDLLYCSPAFIVTPTKLTAVIAANTGKFNGWPDPAIVDFKTARGAMGLKLVSRNSSGWIPSTTVLTAPLADDVFCT
ncbi:hypothetical protein JVT61DRAFT_12194 [Boletus reticuloceps]|uniref:Uncharacterized protein n=1 Tax=Boletus reticuloceps TaxID=495285 RepID=A0A8I3A509_9AGAM|nr:hypothetical protein JVT61DRAFT_12194 [Boletus reticuloceps]